MKSEVTRVLAFDLHPRSFGFAIIQLPSELIDWGCKTFRQSGRAVKIPMPKKFAHLIERSAPDVVIIREARNALVRKRVRQLHYILWKRRLPLRFVSEKQIRQSFSQTNRSKFQIATAIAARYPELSPYLRVQRKPWESERYGISVFYAVAIGVAYLMRLTKKRHSIGTFSALPR